jgi:hypothetical protein
MLRRALLILVPALLAASVARADDTHPSTSTPRAVDAARRAFEKGVKQYDAGDFEGALISLTQSYAVFHSITTLQDLALVEEKTAHCVEALKHLRACARSANADPKFVENEIPRLTTSCNAKVGHIRVLAPSSDVAVSLDGKRVDPTDVLDVTPGDHVIAGQGAGVNDSQHVTVATAQTIEVRFGPHPSPPAMPVPVVAPAAADASMAPPSRDVVSEPAGESPAPTPFWTGQHTWGAILGATALASVGVGVAFGLEASSEKSSIATSIAGRSRYECAGSSSTSAACDSIQSQNSAQRRDAAISDVGLGVGVALAVAAGIVWFFPGKTEHTGSLWIAPTSGRDGGGVLAGGRF